MHLLIDSQVKIEQWRELIIHNAFANPFQTFEFYNFFNSLPKFSAKVFAVSDDEELLALCVVTFQKQGGILGYFSRRSIIYGGPLVQSDNRGATAIQFLIQEMDKVIHKKVIYCEIYNYFNFSQFRVEFEKQGWTYLNHYNIQININKKSINEVLATMNSNKRREITQSLQSGVITKVADNFEDIKELYKILAELYHTRVRSPLPSFDFFKQLFYSQNGVILIVTHNDKVIGGSVCVYLPFKAIYTYYYCGIRDYKKSIFPSNMAIYAAIEFGIKNNLKYVDLMGAGKPDQEYGVRDFKLRFGGALLEHGRFLKTYNKFLYELGKIGLSMINMNK